VTRALAAAGGIVAGGYAGIAGLAWYRYGTVSEPVGEEKDELLDRFMPEYEIVERHSVEVSAPAPVTFDVAKNLDLFESTPVRQIFRARERFLGARPDETVRPRGLLPRTQSMGWVVLVETPDREVVVGAVTRPWEADVVFRSVPPQEFAAFAEPDYVKIVWTLRADAVDPATSVFRTETRAVATDADARRKFRRYWAFVSPGIFLIRWFMLGPLKAEAERRHTNVG
jgi:hypothetical protein